MKNFTNRAVGLATRAQTQSMRSTGRADASLIRRNEVLYDLGSVSYIEDTLLLSISAPLILMGYQAPQEGRETQFDTWRRATGPYLGFNPEAAFPASASDPSPEEDVFEEGQYRLVGDLLNLMASEQIADCAGQTGGRRLSAAKVNLQPVEDECSVRGDQVFAAPIERTSP